MNCAVHTDTPAAAFCRTCGKALCENCKRDVMGAIYCEPCIAARLQAASAAMPGQPVVAVAAVSNAPSPGIAMLLGFIPGVGAMYNGQFMKALIHVVIFIMLVIATSNISGIFLLLVFFWEFYMAFDAYKTAQAKMLGLPLPDPLGLDKLFGIQDSSAPTVPFAAPATSASAPTATLAAPTSAAPVAEQPVPDPHQSPVPTGAIVLIALGVLFLLGNIGMFNLNKMWPLLVIGVGLWIAYNRMSQTQGSQGGR
jgi:TM2 domain-containing membrane protein YozV